jgi:ribulose-phosphate 3-epimerase
MGSNGRIRRYDTGACCGRRFADARVFDIAGADMAIIAASILDADFARLEHEVTRVAAAGVDAFSLDVMDGHFVPRLTFGEYVVARVRNWIDLPIEIHLMVERPDVMVQRMCDAGADMVVFHLEAAADPFDVVERVRAEHRTVGVALRLDTPIDEIPRDLLAAVDLVNLVAVPLGYGGSASAADTFDRLRALRERIEAAGLQTAIEVDGGVKPENAVRYAQAGADILTVGTGIYHATDAGEAVRTLRDSTRPGDDVARVRARRFLSVPSTAPVDDASRRARLDEVRSNLDIPRRIWDPLTTRR